jgi:hypothetical protein
MGDGLSAISYQLLAIGYRLLAICFQYQVEGRLWKVAKAAKAAKIAKDTRGRHWRFVASA